MSEKFGELEWEKKLLAAGVPTDEVEYRRYREEMLMRRCVEAQQQIENTATSAILMLEGLSMAEAVEEMKDEKVRDDGSTLGDLMDDFYEELRHCTKFFGNPKATDTWKLDEAEAV